MHLRLHLCVLQYFRILDAFLWVILWPGFFLAENVSVCVCVSVLFIFFVFAHFDWICVYMNISVFDSFCFHGNRSTNTKIAKNSMNVRAIVEWGETSLISNYSLWRCFASVQCIISAYKMTVSMWFLIFRMRKGVPTSSHIRPLEHVVMFSVIHKIVLPFLYLFMFFFFFKKWWWMLYCTVADAKSFILN